VKHAKGGTLKSLQSEYAKNSLRNPCNKKIFRKNSSGKVVAMMTFQHKCEYTYVDVAVAEKHKGHGKSMIAEVEGRALKLGHRALVLDAIHDAVPAWRRLGFNYVKPVGALVQMSKPIGCN